ncbi:hypothetical protein [Bosea lathyri]|uniref:Uncharacterized protein n=1 Tax=Bosea lathyri TaxID=1036778 RepID=A0A1H5TIP5_9HYPH|nr:hypothetical protein [Bosea lathyri]SEF62636.1 hypothetical protein SAMN04488115_101673 [Bosea lathyri]
MIAIFVLLGLGFLGGGAAAIVDGLPYLVLERGFTQVIIGTVVATAGVILLALAWVLVEVRRVKATLANAAMAMSVASMASAPQQQDLAVAAHDLMPSRDLPPASGAGMAGAAIGAAAGAGGVLAATHAFQTSSPADAANDEATSAEHASVERDLFGDQAAEKNQVERSEQEPANPPEPAPVLPVAEAYAFPAFDPFASIDAPSTSNAQESSNTQESSNATEPLEDTPAVAAGATELVSDEPAEAIPDTQDTEDAVEETAEDHVPADANRAEAESSEHAGPIDWPDRDAPHVPEPEPVDVGRGTDEFSFLRESLTGRQPERDQAGGRIEPSLEHGDETAAATGDADAWMHPASRRKDPWFGDTPIANDPDQAEPGLDEPDLDAPNTEAHKTEAPKMDAPKMDAPPWPPQTRGAAMSDRDAEEENHSAVDDTGSALSENAHAPFPEHDEATSAAAPEPEASTDAPAASNEGIVGAYQVGDAHFTIYADGSIQARTPDGNYSFASMDELKVYLASEKSRLGA